jgi:hypothetical protein
METKDDELVKKLATEHLGFLAKQNGAVLVPAAFSGKEARQWL